MSAAVPMEPLHNETRVKKEDIKLEDGTANFVSVKEEVLDDEDDLLDSYIAKPKNSLLVNSLNNILSSIKQTTVLPAPETARKPALKSRPPNGTVLNISNLDMSQPLEDQIVMEDLGFLHHAMKYSKKIVMITGAGISVQSGIPDFRSSNGLFQGLASKSTGSGKNLFDYNILRSEDGIQKFEDMIERLYYLSQTSKPSPFHVMTDQLASQNRLLRLYTQNIDCLDIELPNLKTQIPLTGKNSETPKAIQLHGNIKWLNCSKCSYITELTDEYFKSRLFGDRKLMRQCPSCKELNEVRAIAGRRTQNMGILRPRIVLYNEFHPDGETIGSINEKDLKSKPDCLIVTGTSLKIPGVRRLVKEMAKSVHSRKGCVIWMNLDLPSQSIIDYVEHFDLIVVGDCQAVPGLVKLYDITNPRKKPVKRRCKSEETDSGELSKKQKVESESTT